MRDTFPALYGPIVHRLISAMGGTPHAVTLQSHLWDVTFMFHWSRNQHVCANRQLRKPFVTAWAKNASDYILAVKEMLPEVPFIVWRTGNERNTPSNERCKNDLMDDMNDATVNFEAELKVHRIQYAGKNPPCRDSIHPAPEVTLKYMDKLMASIAANVPEVVGTLKQFSSNDYAKGRSRQ